MRAYSTDALVLRTYRYGEADQIVVFLTEDRGKKRGVAKNATKSRRRFGAALEPLTRGRATYVEREARELVRLDRIEPKQSPLSAVRARLGDEAVIALGHAAYFAELLDEWSPDGSPNERLFRLGAAVGEALRKPARGSIARAGTSSIGCCASRVCIRRIDRCARCGEARLAAGAVFMRPANGVRLSRRARTGSCGSRARRMRFLRTAGRRTPRDADGLRRPRVGASRDGAVHRSADCFAPGERTALGACRSRSWRPNRDSAGPDLQAVRLLGGPGLSDSAAAGHRDGRRHDASGDVSPRARAAALERRVRAAVAAAGGRPLRRKPEPALQAPSVPGHPEARPDDIQDLYLQSLEACGIDLRAHDVRFEEDNWESPTLGAWGIGWQVLYDGLEITQFTYFQQAGGLDLSPISVELTYGLERFAMALQAWTTSTTCSGRPACSIATSASATKSSSRSTRSARCSCRRRVCGVPPRDVQQELRLRDGADQFGSCCRRSTTA
jgi:hypothetical protein